MGSRAGAVLSCPSVSEFGIRVSCFSPGNETMNLIVRKDHLSTMDGATVDIFDEDRDDTVGEVKYEKGVGRHITLYGRYRGTVQTHDECVAFVKGVEAVLEHMIG